MRSLSVSVLALAIVVSLAGCASSSGEAASRSESGASGALSVVATTTQVADFTANVGGDDIELTELVAPNESAHQFDPTAADLTALAAADVIVTNGAGLESWLDSAIEASGFSGTLVESARAVERSTDGNPHVWTDPNNAIIQVEAIEQALSSADPDSASEYESRAAAYSAQLTELDEWIGENVSRVPPERRLVVSNHDAFHYYLDRYDITFVGSIIPSFEDNAEPTAAQIDELVDAIEKTGVRAIFSESTISDKTARAIAEAAHVSVYSGEDALYGDSLGEAGSAGDTYIGATVHNTTVIVESWGSPVSELPADLVD
jgi:ABC-type Zn uptake system ZnuABC Zn-binding protein ZnuA